MVSKRLVVGLAAVLSVFGAACAASSKDGPDPAPAPDPRPADEDSADAAAPAAVTVDQYCAAFCKKVHACDASQGVSSCESTCAAANKTAIPKLRPEVATSMMSCIADSSCSDVESNAAPKDCFDTELASAKADAAAKKACSALESASSTCGVAFDLSTCLEEAAVYTDATAASVGACADRICGSVESCLQAVAPLSFGYSASASCAVVAPGQTFHSSNAQCNSCVGSSCCATASACDANADCTGLLACVSDCSTQSCVDECASIFPDGVDDLNAFGSCVNDSCSSECN